MALQRAAVLDAVQGLLLVAQEAVRRRTSIGPWNVGPLQDRTVTVGALGDMVASAWGGDARVRREGRSWSVQEGR